MEKNMNIKYRIAVCDDDPKQTGILGSLILSVTKKLAISAGVELFTSAVLLLDKIDEDTAKGLNSYDRIFLDIRQPDMDGITFGKRLYAMQVETELVLVTSYPEYAVEGYSTHAFQFLVKPVTEGMLEAVIRAVFDNRASDKILEVSGSGRRELIPIKDIECIIAENKYTRIYSVKGSYLESRSLDSLELSLMRYGFVRTHRAALMNIKYYSALDKKEVVLTSGRSLPVSRRRIPELRNAVRKELERRII